MPAVNVVDKGIQGVIYFMEMESESGSEPEIVSELETEEDSVV